MRRSAIIDWTDWYVAGDFQLPWELAEPVTMELFSSAQLWPTNYSRSAQWIANKEELQRYIKNLWSKS
jgi:hypothetical protein